MNIDFLIIGQGLAGSLLAWELIARGCTVIIVDNGKENASEIAAGLINPITGRRFVKSADIDYLLPAAKQRYKQLAEFFRQDFYLEKPMLRLFRSEAEYNNAQKRLLEPAYTPYLGKIHKPENKARHFHATYGFIGQKQTGYLLTKPLLSCLKDFFSTRSCYRQTDFNADAIQFAPVLQWQDLKPAKIIFCEGYRAAQNPWFSWLPFQLAKGEILTLAHSDDLPDTLLNYGNWLIPLNDRHMRIGATFDHKHINTQITGQAKTELLNALKPISANLAQARCIKQQANIRPCTLDKRPFIGNHPRHQQLAIFNGFGAKGSLQIPWYSRQFADALLSSATIPSDIQRYYATHFPG
ncbi:MAG: FAD-binding oxidoreductase [Methylovulum sp.]|nr:FAD-binding oxidoreductase [Methylovulum sp.]